MTVEKQIAYNKYSAEKYGWEPEEFGVTGFDENLIKKIKEFQDQHGLVVDGLCGSGTSRHLKTLELADIEIPNVNATGEYIICQGEKVPIKWDKVVVWNEEGGMKASNFRHMSQQRNIKCFVTHWDATLSSHHCARILSKRKLSVHFCIDNDGTIYQMADTNDVCFHAGNANNRSVGVEISNAYYLKWQDWYQRKGFGERPVITNAMCHGSKMKPFTGFYPIQIQALIALYEAINVGCNIPLVAPTIKKGVDPEVANGSFRGFCSHYHLTRRKIDCAGLDLNMVCQKAITLKNHVS